MIDSVYHRPMPARIWEELKIFVRNYLGCILVSKPKIDFIKSYDGDQFVWVFCEIVSADEMIRGVQGKGCKKRMILAWKCLDFFFFYSNAKVRLL